MSQSHVAPFGNFLSLLQAIMTVLLPGIQLDSILHSAGLFRREIQVGCSLHHDLQLIQPIAHHFPARFEEIKMFKGRFMQK